MKEIKKLVLEAGLTQNEESRNVVFKHCSKCGSAIFKVSRHLVYVAHHINCVLSHV